MIRTWSRVIAALALALFIRSPAGAETVGSIERLDPRFDAIIPPGAALEKLADGLAWSEGPVWDHTGSSLLFSDTPRNAVFRWTEGGGVTTYLRNSGYTGTAPFPGEAPGSNGLTFDRDGRLVMCQQGDRRIGRQEHDGRITVLADRYDGKRFNSPNDLVFKSNGDLYFTDPTFGLPNTYWDKSRELLFQGVFRLTPDGTVTALLKDLAAPDGIAFSPDEHTLYVSNADLRIPIWMAYPVLADGTVGPGREFADARAWVKADEGVPDGIKVDRNGNIFATGPAGIHVFAPDGTRLGLIHTGVQTGNLAWGGDGRTLYIAANHWLLRLRTKTQGSDPRAAR